MGNRQNALASIPGLNQARYGAGQALMNIGQQQQNLGQAAIDTDYGDFQEWRDWDQNKMGVLTNALAALNGGGSTATGTQPNPNYRSAGQNAAGYAALLASLWG